MLGNVERVDPEIARAIRGELSRQRDGLELIASENFTHPAILEAAEARGCRTQHGKAMFGPQIELALSFYANGL